MKNKSFGKSGFRFTGALVLFAVITIINVIAILSYEYIISVTNNIRIINLTMLAVTVILSALCTIVDIMRRRSMIDGPVNEILLATERIAAGDFSVRLEISRPPEKYTEYDLIFDRLNTVAEELGKSEVLKNDFISNVSHEIKTPLSVIQNYAMILGDTSLDEQTRKKYCDTILSAAKKLSLLVTDILKLNKLENQKIAPEYEKLNLTEMLEEAIIGFEDLIEKKELILDCRLDSVSIFSSRSSLEIVFNNLISNAVKFTDKGGKIGVSLQSQGTGAVIEISDTGPGISPEVGKRIFEKFYQADTSHAGEGNGLGLALVKRVIDTLGAEISVKSELGEGSTFTVRLRGDEYENS